jgi:hypothetical protein
MSCTHLGSENPHKSLRARHFFPATCWKDHKETTTVPVHKNTLAKMVKKLLKLRLVLVDRKAIIACVLLVPLNISGRCP